MKISYNWLQSFFEKKLPRVEDVTDALIFHAFEVEDIEKLENDIIFEVKILPDRAHDCLCHYGIAKEVSAILGYEIKNQNEQSFSFSDFEKKDESFVRIESNLCNRYIAFSISGVKNLETPVWMKERLNAIGQRSKNLLVDATNYTLFNTGQPIHVFDADKIEGSIVVRNSKIGESITLLDGKTVTLDEEILVIADEKSPLAIAGIKGGAKAEVDENTKNIIVEVANFDAVSIRKSAKKLGISTDASKRFENNLSPDVAQYGMKEVVSHILSNTDGEIKKYFDFYNNPQEETIIKTTTEYLNKKLGTSFKSDEIEKAFNSLSFSYKKDGDDFEITIPKERLDLKEEYDLLEEVGRILGYENIVSVLPEVSFVPLINDIFYKISFIRNSFIEKGYSEIYTHTFVKNGELVVSHGAKGKDSLRTNLSSQLKIAYEMNRLNAPLLNLDEIKIFEIGTVFPEKDKEEIHVAWIDKSGVHEEALSEYAKDFPVSEMYDSILPVFSPTVSNFSEWSSYPFITRDIALWVPKDVKSFEVKKIIKDNAGDLILGEPRLFDQFEKDDKKSYAFRLVFQSKEKTLTDEDIEKNILSINNELQKNTNWIVR